jgi:hypothetical protein
VLVVGESQGPVDIGGRHFSANSESYGVLARLDGEGQVRWAAQVTESGVHVEPMAVVVDAGGSAVVLWSRVPRPRPEDFPNPPVVVWAGISRFDG